MVRAIKKMKNYLDSFRKKYNPLKLFKHVSDSRNQSRCIRSVSSVLQMTLEGIMSGIVTTRGIESFSESRGRRIPDSTLRSILGKANPKDVAKTIPAVVNHAYKNSDFFDSKTLPINLTEIDGKRNSGAKEIESDYFVYDGNGGYYCKALRALQVSHHTPVFLGQRLIKANEGEPDNTIAFLQQLFQDYENTTLLEVFSFDAGFAAKHIVDYIREKDCHYIQRIKGNQKVLHNLLISMFECEQIPLASDNTAKNSKEFTRELYRIPLHGLQKWEHVREAWCIRVKVYEKKTKETKIYSKYYLTSLEPQRLSDKEVLLAVRSHWAIENKGFFNLDRSFKEDDYPLANTAMETVSLLRLLAYNLIALHTTRKSSKRKNIISFNDLFKKIYALLLQFDTLYPERTTQNFIT